MVENLLKYNNSHYDLLKKSDKIGCYCCCKFFNFADIEEWITERRIDNGLTAMCPTCGIDSVLPSLIEDVEITEEVLHKLRDKMFPAHLFGQTEVSCTSRDDSNSS